jgi:hypothetical protein
MGPKAALIQSKADIDQANGLAQTAINRLSGVIQSPAYDPFEVALSQLQGTGGNPGVLDGVSQELAALIAQTPDDAEQEAQ